MTVFSLFNISQQNSYFASSYMYARWFFSEIIYLMHFFITFVQKRIVSSYLFLDSVFSGKHSFELSQKRALFTQCLFITLLPVQSTGVCSQNKQEYPGMEFMITDNYMWNVAHPHQTWHFVWGFMGVFGAHWKARAKSPELDTTPIVLERKTRCLI